MNRFPLQLSDTFSRPSDSFSDSFCFDKLLKNNQIGQFGQFGQFFGVFRPSRAPMSVMQNNCPEVSELSGTLICATHPHPIESSRVK